LTLTNGKPFQTKNGTDSFNLKASEALAISETPEAQHWFEEMDRSVSDRIKEFEDKDPG
jgi:hypothetical protein